MRASSPPRSTRPDLRRLAARRGAALRFAVLLIAVPLFAGLPLVLAEEETVPTYPPGKSTHTLEGLKTVLVLPDAAPPEGERLSLVILLHEAGGSGSTLADRFAAWPKQGYVLCAPKAGDLTWEPGDLKRTLAIAAHLKQVLPIDARRVHVVGYENGGNEMSPLVFDDDLRPCSAAWLTSGYRGSQISRWAKTDLGVCAIAGSEDESLRQARGTVEALRKKVRNVEVHVQMGLGHAFPGEYLPYLLWWMGAQEGRIVPGDDQSFEWTEDLETAIASQSVAKKGGVFVWFYTQDDAQGETAKTIQHRIFFDPEVRFLGRQVPCVKLDAAAHAKRLEQFGCESVPALVVLDKQGEVKARYVGTILPKKVARTLRTVAPKRTMPK